MTSLNTSDNTLISTLWKTRAKVYIEVPILHWDLYFPWKNGMRNQFLQTGFIKGSWHIAIVSSNSIEFNELFPILQCGNISGFLSLVIYFLWILEENWIFHIHEHNLILQFLGPKCWVTWSSAFYFSVGQKEYNLYLYLNLTWLHLREKVSSIWIQNILLPNSRILW